MKCQYMCVSNQLIFYTVMFCMRGLAPAVFMFSPQLSEANCSCLAWFTTSWRSDTDKNTISLKFRFRAFLTK